MLPMRCRTLFARRVRPSPLCRRPLFFAAPFCANDYRGRRKNLFVAAGYWQVHYSALLPGRAIWRSPGAIVRLNWRDRARRSCWPWCRVAYSCRAVAHRFWLGYRGSLCAPHRHQKDLHAPAAERKKMRPWRPQRCLI